MMTRGVVVLGFIALGGCAGSLVPEKPPVVSIPASFKEVADWQPANPSDDTALRPDWWTKFEDPELSRLEQLVVTRNQTVAAALAAYEQAEAVVRQNRSALWPTASLSASATTNETVGAANPVAIANGGSRYAAGLGATWELDFFGRLRAGLLQSKATSSAQRATLGNVLLAAQAQLAANYVQLRGIDAQRAAYATTIKAYRRALEITANRYNAGVAARSDVLQARTTLANAEAAALDLNRQRKVLEHAIAVAVGMVPAELAIPELPWQPIVPRPPLALPSTLLERRPDIAAAERNFVAAGAALGIQRAAFFPSFTLTGGLNQNASTIARLGMLGTSAWSLGLSGALTLFDFGARKGRVAQARAALDQAAATYRQTVLTAFQQVEDGLSSAVLLAEETEQLRNAADASAGAEEIAMKQYLGGLVDYTNVVTAQATALTARRAAIGAVVNQQLAAITLSQALGGGWHDSALDRRPPVPGAAGRSSTGDEKPEGGRQPPQTSGTP